MARRKKKLPGLNRGPSGYWLLNKVILNHGVIRRSTHTKDYAEAERRALRWIQAAEEAAIHGKRSRITFNEAAAFFIEKEIAKPQIQKKKSSTFKCDINDLNKLMPFIGALYLDQIYQESIDPYIKAQREKGNKATTINRSLRTLSHILKLAATTWRDDHHKAYLDMPPSLKQLPEIDKRITQPLEYHEEQKLLKELNTDYQIYWQFAVNTGARQMTQARLRWEWEVKITQYQRSAFLIPSYIKQIKNTKNGKDFLLILNKEAQAIIEQQRGKNADFVFPSAIGKAHGRFNQRHFQAARKRAGLDGIVTWHSARTTFASRLRATKINQEDRAQLLGHSKSITTQYSWASIGHLIECVDRLCTEDIHNDQAMDLQSLFRFSRDQLNK